MAKVSLNKVTPIKNIDPKVINICGEEITVVQYLPMADKINMMDEIISNVFDETGLSSPVRMEIYFYLSLIKTYTNISITDKMMENAVKTYDLLEMNHIIDTVIEAIPEEEFDTVFDHVQEMIEHIERFNFSFAGTMKTMSTDYSATSLNVQDLMSELQTVEKNETLRAVLDNLN